MQVLLIIALHIYSMACRSWWSAGKTGISAVKQSVAQKGNWESSLYLWRMPGTKLVICANCYNFVIVWMGVSWCGHTAGKLCIFYQIILELQYFVNLHYIHECTASHICCKVKSPQWFVKGQRPPPNIPIIWGCRQALFWYCASWPKLGV